MSDSHSSGPSSEPLLSGLRVVEAATMVMVPAAGTILADYGAEVVKVEPAVGDLNRRGPKIPGMPESEIEYTYLQENRNKRGVVVDLRTDEGHEIFLDLIRQADVFLTNYRASALEKLDLTYERLGELNPRLIYAHGTGYGDRGPEVTKPGYDVVCYWSRSGIEATLFPLEGWLGSFGYGTGDHPTGMSLFGAIMMGLFRRERTGKGGRVTTSLLASGAWANSSLISARLVDAEFQERRPREEVQNYSAPYYRSSDDRIFKLAIVDSEGSWPGFCRAIGREELIDNPRFATAEARRETSPEIVRICDEFFADKELEELARLFAEQDIPFSPVATYDDVAVDEQMQANGIFLEVDDPEHGTLKTINTPFTVEGSDKVPPRPAPRLGEHTDEVLAELGVAPERVAELRSRGVVG